VGTATVRTGVKMIPWFVPPAVAVMSVRAPATLFVTVVIGASENVGRVVPEGVGKGDAATTENDALAAGMVNEPDVKALAVAVIDQPAGLSRLSVTVV
jgi:hypothetical protein